MRYDKPQLAMVARASAGIRGYPMSIHLDSFKDIPGSPYPGQVMGSRDGVFPPNDSGIPQEQTAVNAGGCQPQDR